MAIFFAFAAIMAKCGCKLICFGCGQEKTMAKSKKNQPAPQNTIKLLQNFDVGA
jgi:hypothetical protein